MLTEKIFDTGELVLNYAESDSLGAPLVLLHGLSAWNGELYRLFDGLAANWHVYAPDLRGHGKSGRGASYHLVDYMRDVVAFVRHLGEPVVLAGHSLGGITAIGVASDYPDGVRALVALDPPLYSRNKSISTRLGARNWFSWVYDTVKSAPSYQTVLARCREVLPPDANDETLRAMANRIFRVAPGTVETVLRDQLLHGFDLESALQSIECPTLLMYADWEQGAAVHDDDADFFKAHVSSAEIVKIPGTNHIFPIERPEIVLQQMDTFLASA